MKIRSVSYELEEDVNYIKVEVNDYMEEDMNKIPFMIMDYYKRNKAKNIEIIHSQHGQVEIRFIRSTKSITRAHDNLVSFLERQALCISELNKKEL